MKLRSAGKSLPRWASYVAYSAKAGRTQCDGWWVDWVVHFLGFGLAFGISLAWEDVLEVLLAFLHSCSFIATRWPLLFLSGRGFQLSRADHISLIPLISREQVSGRNANPSYCNTRWAWSFPATLLQVAEEGREFAESPIGTFVQNEKNWASMNCHFINHQLSIFINYRFNSSPNLP
jgi:hypothetical protein